MKVAVIGAGASGLTCIKACLEEGLEPVCFEQEDEIGGLWRFTEKESHSSVYRSTIINTSKEMMCFSDFPIPRDFPPFMHHKRIMEYFHMYAKHFDLYKYVRLQHKVVELKQAADFEETGAWEIAYQDLQGGQPDLVKKEVFGAVMLCIGHHSAPTWPSFPGMEKFQGKQMHSHSYKDFREFEDKTVLIVGEFSYWKEIVQASEIFYLFAYCTIIIPSPPRVIIFKFLLQSHQKYNITSHSMENLAHRLLRWKMIMLPILTSL